MRSQWFSNAIPASLSALRPEGEILRSAEMPPRRTSSKLIVD